MKQKHPPLNANEKRIEFLRRHGADTSGHSGLALLDHLRGVRDILHGWNARQALCDAGLFHSVYGTESFRTVTLPLGLRPRVQELIGAEAEEIAYRFGAMTYESFRSNRHKNDTFEVDDRFASDTISLSSDEWRDLVELFLANAIEQFPRIGIEHVLSFCERYAWIAAYATPAAQETLIDLCRAKTPPSDKDK